MKPSDSSHLAGFGFREWHSRGRGFEHPATLYLDFDGHYQSRWGAYRNINSPAYDSDGDPSSFSPQELNNIHQIWLYAAEDFAPFDINVTTVEPPSFGNGVALRIVIGGDSAWTGGTSGGIAYLDAFTNSSPNVVYVFPDHLWFGYPKYVGDAVSHEAGHAFGLNHQSKYNGAALDEFYYSGPGDGTAPLLGYSYLAARSMWWYGTSTSSATYQNDMQVIGRAANGFGFRVDDHGDAIAAATNLPPLESGIVGASGIIGQHDDLDFFTFDALAGTISLTVDTREPFNNLDAVLFLYDEAGNLLAASDPSDSFDASITYHADAGSYFAALGSHGISSNASSTNHGFSVGQYEITGTIILASAEAPTAPSGLTATATSSSQISLTWIDNSINEEGCHIERIVDGEWTLIATVAADVVSWQDTDLLEGTTYPYRVQAQRCRIILLQQYRRGGHASNCRAPIPSPHRKVWQGGKRCQYWSPARVVDRPI